MTKTTKMLAVAALGFTAGILLAPKTGAQTRKELKNGAAYAKKFLSTKADVAKQAAYDAQGAVVDAVDEVNDEALAMTKSAKASARKVGREATIEAKKLQSEARTRASRVATTAKKTADKVKRDTKARLKE